MSTIENRDASALLVVDAQTGVLAECHDKDAVLARIGDLVGRARRADVPVVWVQHCSGEFPEGSESWQIASQLDPADGEARVLKRYGDAFEDTTLDAELGRLRAGRIVVAGAMTDACIRCTIHGGLARGYDVTLAGDAHTTADLRPWGGPIGPAESIAFLNMCWENTSAPGRETAAAGAADVTF